MEEFLRLVYNIDNVEYTEDYDDVDDARADYIRFINDDDCEYVVLEKVETDFIGEEFITILEQYFRSECDK
jgi:hypothetical protein